MSAPTLPPGVAWQANAKQRELMATILARECTIIGFGGAIRGTKTWGTLGVVITLARMFPQSRWGVVRADSERLRKNVFPSFEVLREKTGGFVGPIVGYEKEARCANGSVIFFHGENYDRDRDLQRWRGLEVNGFVLEEADELQEASLWKAVERAGAWFVPGLAPHEQPPPLVLCTFNPSPFWPLRVFYEPWKEGTLAPPFAFIPATIFDNEHAPESYKKNLKNLPAAEYARFVESDWSKVSELRYYDTLAKSVHLVPRSRLPDPLPHHWTYWGSYDWGSRHWAVFGLWAKDTQGRTFLLDALWMRKQKDAAQARSIAAFVDDLLPSELSRAALQEVYAGHDCWSKFDARAPEGAIVESTADIFEREGIYLVKAVNDLVDGGKAVQRALHVDRDADGVATAQLYLVDTAGTNGDEKITGHPNGFQQLAEIRPDPNNIRKPMVVDADAQGRGGNDFADMVRYGVASTITTPDEETDDDRTERAESVARAALTDRASRQEADAWAKLERQTRRRPMVVTP